LWWHLWEVHSRAEAQTLRWAWHYPDPAKRQARTSLCEQNFPAVAERGRRQELRDGDNGRTAFPPPERGAAPHGTAGLAITGVCFQAHQKKRKKKISEKKK